MIKHDLRTALGVASATLLTFVALPASASPGRAVTGSGPPVVGKTVVTGNNVTPVRGVPTTDVLPAHPNSSTARALPGKPGVKAFPILYSQNWAGYVNTGRVYNGMSSTWRQPVVTCRSESYDVFWVGLDGWTNGTVEQDGTAAYCSGAGATPQYFTWWEMYPTNSIQGVFVINAGDLVTSTVSYANGIFTLRVTDSTSHRSFTTAQRCASNLTCSRNSAEWIAEAPSSSTARFNLAPFAPITFYNDYAWSRVLLRDSARYITGWSYSAIVMKQTDTDAVPSYLSSNGSAFNVYWYNET
jgi:hypothetical protein